MNSNGDLVSAKHFCLFTQRSFVPILIRVDSWLSSSPRMKILLACSEVHPYSKSGGLADMVGALGKFLARDGNQVGIVRPKSPC